ncbi:MAG: metallophosphoesterase family protein, partial [Deltaproteobacteria bacterium]|nr:metallophosphoesterase family protein [Deltaproteobacteria bacterium]
GVFSTACGSGDDDDDDASASDDDTADDDDTSDDDVTDDDTSDDDTSDDDVTDDDTSDDDTSDDDVTDDDTSDDDTSDDDTADDDTSDDDTGDDDDDDVVPVECDEVSFVRGPYLQDVTQETIRVMWRTDAAGNSVVEYDEDETLDERVVDNELTDKHDLQLTGLAPGTSYNYRADSCGVKSSTADFSTAPVWGTPFKFAVIGDTQDHPEVHTQVAAAALDWRPNILLHVGDLVGDGWRKGDYDTEYFTPAADLLQRTTVFPSVGNHDANSPYYFDSFHYPGNGKWGYYSFTYSNVFFIALNTTWLYYPGSHQYRWLIEQLESDAAADADWVIVYAHHPPYCEGWEGYDGEWMVRQFLVPVFEDYGIDFYFSGHTHDYERGNLNGVNYIISGGGGGSLDDVQVRDYEHVTVWAGVHHFTGVTVDGKTLTLKAYDLDDKEIDSYTITK